MSSDEEDITFYGNALDPIDEDSLPRKKPITAEDQFAKDERGRRRFHGAFTGGFSAGFFNSVGSLGGWQPANFISSRVSRAESKGQTIFDFMDEEDTGEHGICPITLQVKPDFDNKAPSRANKKRNRIPGTEKLQHAPAIQKMLAPVRDTVGVKLLMKMGWKPGQGVGPRITKKEKKRIKHQEKTVKKVYGCSLPTDVTKSEENSESDLDIDLDEITFAPDDYQPYVVNPKQNVFGIGYQGMDRNPILSSKKPELSVLTVGGKTIRGQAFGVSVFEDEDEDIYSTEDMSNYDFSLPSAKEKRKVERKSRFEPLHKCIEGFHVAYKPPKPREIFPLPEVPQDFVPLQSRKNRWDVATRNVVPKKITSVTERNKIFNEIHTNTEKLGETESQRTEETIEKEIETFKPSNASSFKPFSADVEKQARYEKFLMFKDLGLKDRISSIYPKTMTEWEKQREQSEFEQAARLYRPLADDLASRFTSGSKLDDVHDMLNPVEKTTDPDLEMMKDAAEKKMYGIFTRRTYDWIPDKIVCKRFNIPEPFKYTLQNAADRKPKESRTSIFDFLKTSNINNLPKTVPKPEPEKLNEIELNSDEKLEEEKQQQEDDTKPEELDSEDEGLGEITDKVDLFKAIFLDTSDEEDGNEAEKVENETPPSSKFTCEEAKKYEEASIIVRSPPRGIFANLDLESLKPKPSLSKNEQDPSKNSLLKDRSDPKPKIIDPLLYGPQLPTIISSSNIKVEPKIEYIKPKRKDNEELVWVEKSKKHKERKKHKKQKHKKHKKHK